jgi:hypothetical protein
MKQNMKNILQVSGISGLISASCCTIPLLLMIFGLSSVTAGSLNSSFSALRWTILIPLGLLSAFIGIYLKIKKKDGKCTLETLKRNKVLAISIIISTFVVWGLLVYAIVPLLWKLVAG